MPLTIHTNKLNIKDGDDYVGVDAVADQTTAQRVTAINQAGATQVTAIETKGAETLESIPDDYTALANEVSDVKGALDDITDCIDYTVYAGEKTVIDEYVQGTPTAPTSEFRCTTGYIACTVGDKIFVHGNASGQKYRFGVQGGSETEWFTDDETLIIKENGNYYIIIANNVTSTPISPSDITTLKVEVYKNQILINTNDIGEITKDIYYLGYSSESMRTRTNNKSEWKIDGDDIICKSKYNYTDGIALLLFDTGICDGIINVTLEQKAITGLSDYCGIVYDYIDKNNFKFFYVLYSTGIAQAYTIVNGSLSSQIFSTSISSNVDFTKQINITLQKKGNYKFFVNNILVGTASYNTALTTNKIGLGCSLVSFNDFTFSNFSINEIDFKKIKYPLKEIVGYGDSIMYGSLASTADKRWFNLLKTKMQAYYPDSTWTNYGQGGYITTSVLNNEVTPNADEDIQIALIMCGTNDVRTDVGIPLATSISNYVKMISICKSFDTVPILFTLTPILRDGSEGTSYGVNAKEGIRQLNDAIREICENQKVICVEDSLAFGQVADLTTVIDSVDKLHPNDAGHQLIFETVYNSVFK